MLDGQDAIDPRDKRLQQLWLSRPVKGPSKHFFSVRWTTSVAVICGPVPRMSWLHSKRPELPGDAALPC